MKYIKTQKDFSDFINIKNEVEEKIKLIYSFYTNDKFVNWTYVNDSDIILINGLEKFAYIPANWMWLSISKIKDNINHGYLHTL
jgi:hypothetical protein